MTPQQIYAVMVLCARDVDVIWHNLAVPVTGNPQLPAAPANTASGCSYITAANWTALAQLRCDDQIISRGENVYYGLVLRCDKAVGPFSAGDHMVAVRGTMDQQEWENNALALFPRPAPGGVGSVGAGFWDVYDSMTLRDLAGGNERSPPAAAIAALVGAGPGKLWVAGHSLGAALATYLTADLQAALAGSAIELDPYFFASPKPGTADYTQHYQMTVSAYTLVNYSLDIVPLVPPEFLGYAALNGGGPTHDVHLIAPLSPGALTPPLPPQNHSPVGYARMLDPGNAAAAALPAP